MLRLTNELDILINFAFYLIIRDYKLGKNVSDKKMASLMMVPEKWLSYLREI